LFSWPVRMHTPGHVKDVKVNLVLMRWDLQNLQLGEKCNG
jgi:hypothetical protein